MEDIIRLYTEPLPKGHEIHCFDEASKQLLLTPRGSIPAKAGQDKRTDYEYERNGTRNLFVAVAPLQGEHLVTITKHRKARDTADFLWTYCMVKHKAAGHIELVLDNLNTHKPGSLQKVWGERKLQQFLKHVTLHFTPKHASWLNLAELEINCIRKQGVKNRIGNEQTLTETVDAIVRERNERKARIQWSFNLDKAKRKFPELYGMGSGD